MLGRRLEARSPAAMRPCCTSGSAGVGSTRAAPARRRAVRARHGRCGPRRPGSTGAPTRRRCSRGRPRARGALRARGGPFAFLGGALLSVTGAHSRQPTCCRGEDARDARRTSPPACGRRHASPRPHWPLALGDLRREALVVQLDRHTLTEATREAPGKARVSRVWSLSAPLTTTAGRRRPAAPRARRRAWRAPPARPPRGPWDRLDRRDEHPRRVAQRAAAAGASVVEAQHPH